MKENLELNLDDLFGEPRGLHVDLIVGRVRQAMDTIAQELIPERPVQARDPELDWVVEEYVDGQALRVEWWMLHPYACSFLHVLRTWEETGASEHAKAVEASARTLLVVWAATIDNARLLESFPELGIVTWDEDSPEGFFAAVRELALQGHVIDTGRREGGETVWALSNVFQQHGTWDA